MQQASCFQAMFIHTPRNNHRLVLDQAVIYFQASLHNFFKTTGNNHLKRETYNWALQTCWNTKPNPPCVQDSETRIPDFDVLCGACQLDVHRQRKTLSVICFQASTSTCNYGFVSLLEILICWRPAVQKQTNGSKLTSWLGPAIASKPTRPME